MLFKNVVGHTELAASMRRRIREGNIPHAHLFLGKEGSGSMALALAYARYTCCPNRSEEDACGVCDVCKKFDVLQYADLHFSFPMASVSSKTDDNYCAQNSKPWREYLLKTKYPTFDGWFEALNPSSKNLSIFVGEAAKIAQQLALRSYEGRHKFQIIWLAERLNEQAANKLLKTLEEPPRDTVFILIAESAETILPTILSRTQLTRIPEIDDRAMVEHLVAQFKLDAGSAQNVARFAQGNYNKALDMVNDAGGQLAFLDQFKQWMRACYKRDIKSIDTLIGALAKSTTRAQIEFLRYGLHFVRQCIVSNYGQSELARFTVEEAEFAKRFAKFIHHGNVIAIAELLNESIDDISKNLNVKIVMMDLSLRMNAELHRPH